MQDAPLPARRGNPLLFALLAGTALGGAGVAHAVELPTGGSVAAGSVAIGAPSNGRMTIQQGSQNAIVNWQSFSIGQGGRVDVVQPSASSAMLSRVTGSTPSTIAGQLNANGQFYLVNPNGVTITKTGVVNAGGFVASTLNTSDEDFIAGRRVFTGRGASAPVVNQGRITVAPGGYAALLGGSVDQSGTVSVPMGKVGYGAGERATLDFSGDGFLQVAVPSAPSGTPGALINHSGRTVAPGGRVEMQAATARAAARQAINLSGVVEARSVGGRSGAIVLGGGLGGTVTVSGRLDASGRVATRQRSRAAGAAASGRRPANGGSITVTGADIGLAKATIDASGAKGGSIRIGGDKQGQGTLQTSRTTTVDPGTTIRADSLGNGNGGTVIVWSDVRTDFAGIITARGGQAGGDGGFAEVSGKQILNYAGLTDLSAAKGRFGTLLLDPFNVAITFGPDSGISSAGGTFTASANDSVISNTTIQNALATANVTVTTGGAGSPGAQAGDIFVRAPIAWAAPTALTLSAFRNIAVGDIAPATISVPTGGTLNLRADNSGTGIGTVAFGGGGSVATVAGASVNIFYNPASNPAGSGVNATSYTAPANYAPNVTGGGTLAAFTLVNTAADLQNVRNTLGGTYAVGRDIDAAAAAGFNGGAGFQPIGTFGATFTGRFEGLGRTIANLSIATPAGTGATGLFAVTGAASISNLTLANLAVSGGDNTGGLVGLSGGATITGVTIGGGVTGADTTGGVVGNMVGGTITNAVSTAAVIGTDNTGGVVGAVQNASLTRSYATGPVIGNSQVGGLVGLAFGTQILQSYATGLVTGRTGTAGGLAGNIGGDGTGGVAASISQSFANGAVTAQTFGGGLAGLVSNNTQITDSYATGLVSAGTAGGGLIGTLNTVPGGGSAAPVGIANTYATGFLTGAGAKGGLIGDVTGTAQTVATSYWDTQTTGQTTSAAGLGTGQTTAQLQGALPAGFTPTTWGRQAADSYPFLNWRYPTGVLAVSGFVRNAAGAPIAGEPARLAAGGTLSYQVNSGANGYYYVARDPLTGAQPQGATVYLDGANRGSSSTDAPTGAGTIPNLDVQIGRALVRTNLATTSGVAGLLASAGDAALSGNVPYSVGTAAGTPTFSPGVALFVEALNAAGLTVDRSLVAAGSIQIAGAGSTVPAGPVTIAPGAAVQSTGGNVVIATSRFTNNAGAGALAAGGRTIVYSSDYDADTRGGLAGGNLYNTSFAATPPGAVPGTGNTFVFTRQPVLTFGAVDGTREYGTAPPAPTGTVTGFVNGDTPAVSYTGAPNLADTTTIGTNVGTYPGAIQVSEGSLASTIGYAFAFTNASVTVTPAPLTVRANDQTKTQGTPFVFTGTEFTATGLRNADTVTSAAIASAGASPAATATGSPYPITIQNAVGSGLSNYAITYVPGQFTVTPGAAQLSGRGFTPLVLALLGDTLSRQLPNFSLPIYAPPDTIEVLPGGGGPIRVAASDALGSIEEASAELDANVAACEQRADRKLRVYTDCVGNALERYADQLELRRGQLPAQLRGVVGSIRAAARRVRSARTIGQARAAVRGAVQAVRKAISLIRADEPGGRVGIRQGAVIANALQSVDNRLARAVGL